MQNYECVRTATGTEAVFLSPAVALKTPTRLNESPRASRLYQTSNDRGFNRMCIAFSPVRTDDKAIRRYYHADQGPVIRSVGVVGTIDSRFTAEPGASGFIT